MSKRTKIWLVAAASLVVLGLIMFTGAMRVHDWDFTKLSTVKYETNTYEINEEFNDILLKTDTANVYFMPSDDGICRLVCYEMEDAGHSVEVQDGTLTINVVDVRNWYDHIVILSFDTPQITVYLPEKEYASIKIRTTTGDICVESISAGALDLSVSTGKVNVTSVDCQGDVKVGVSTGKTKLTDVSCRNVISDGNTGDIFLQNVIATEQFSIERSTGSVKFDGCDAAEIFVTTDTGDVKGTLLSDKVFIISSDTGSVDVPKTITGGRCEIATDTGDVKIQIK